MFIRYYQKASCEMGKKYLEANASAFYCSLVPYYLCLVKEYKLLVIFDRTALAKNKALYNLNQSNAVCTLHFRGRS